MPSSSLVEAALACVAAAVSGEEALASVAAAVLAEVALASVAAAVSLVRVLPLVVCPD